MILIGDLLPDLLDTFSVLLNNLFYPVLTNPINQEGWTSVVVDDVKQGVQEMQNAIVEMKGSMINKIILPIPIAVDEVMKISPNIARGFVNLPYYTSQKSVYNMLNSYT